MVVTNHTYDVVGSYVPMKEMGGGSGLKYAASSIVYLSKKKEKDGTQVIGNIIKAKNQKSRLTKENSECEVRLTYNKGLDKYYGLLQLAEKHDIFKKVSTKYELPDGRKVFGKTINDDPQSYFTDEVMTRSNEEYVMRNGDEKDLVSVLTHIEFVGRLEKAMIQLHLSNPKMI